MRPLGFPLQDVALVALVAGFCWALGGMVAVAAYHAVASLFRGRGDG
jgi:hypothetical protein